MSTNEQYYLELLKKLLEGSLSVAERETLLELAETDTKKKLLMQYLDTPQNDNEKRLEAEIIYEKTKPNDLYQASYVENRHSIFVKNRYLIAAICVSCLVIAFWLIAYKSNPSLKQQNEWLEMATDRGERKFFRMSDGTEIWLNSESHLKVKKGYGKEHRILTLEGEGYFSVAKNESLPLYLNALDTEIKVLGTVFNVRAYPEEERIATSLMEGKVELHVGNGDGKRNYMLSPGDKVEVLNRNRPVDKQHLGAAVDILKENNTAKLVDYKKNVIDKNKALEIMWVENKLVFNGDSLTEAVKKMERWYNKTIVVQNKNLYKQLFTGVFQETSCEQVLDLLQKTGVKFSYKVSNGIIYIK
ncbi:FecR family protein [Sphingobacterium arenae]|uniref:DUF4974 domain-containing protein n=1 Tax=Sphingobacterium arenae TaxID=1280598 RepID=A0ABR7Y512_9SPHI|nr:FecR domain-containing protein [Sphingobacterium arenae]MBD1426343.1 DUF4974 domain-containing protein [Sphingobacterium arenae]